MSSHTFTSPVPIEPLLNLCERVKDVAHAAGDHALFESATRARAAIAGELVDDDAVLAVLQTLRDGSGRWSVEDHRDQRALSAWFVAWLAWEPELDGVSAALAEMRNAPYGRHLRLQLRTGSGTVRVYSVEPDSEPGLLDDCAERVVPCDGTFHGLIHEESPQQHRWILRRYDDLGAPHWTIEHQATAIDWAHPYPGEAIVEAQLQERMYVRFGERVVQEWLDPKSETIASLRVDRPRLELVRT